MLKLLKNLFITLKKQKGFKKFELIVAFIFILIMIIFFSAIIGWSTAFTSLAFAIIYDDVKNMILEIYNKNFNEEDTSLQNQITDNN